MWGLVRCLWTPSSEASCLRLALYLALTGNDNPMYECMQAEARVLILDRTPWHMTWEACDAVQAGQARGTSAARSFRTPS